MLNFENNKKQIEALKDIHKGERVFIIGTGPSLNKTNLSLIKDETLLGVNTLYRGYSNFKINCDYYAVSDRLVWNEHFKYISKLDSPLFLSNGALDSYLNNGYCDSTQKDPILIRLLGYMFHTRKFSKDLTLGAYNGNTVIIDICLQLAYYMGFKNVYLLGCDCDYSGLHRFDGLKTECTAGGAVEKWSEVFVSYEICRRAYEIDSREIINATVGGKLEIFKRQSLKEVMK